MISLKLLGIFKLEFNNEIRQLLSYSYLVWDVCIDSGLELAMNTFYRHRNDFFDRSNVLYDDSVLVAFGCHQLKPGMYYCAMHFHI